jgi:NDP-sugar pyrophosphorylase family protein
LVESDSVLILNGDSYTPADLVCFVAGHIEAQADLSVVVVPADYRNDCGVIALGSGGRVVGFKEKESLSTNSYVNAGIYLATHSLLCEIPSMVKLSLEEQLIPKWLAMGKSVRGFVSMEKCTDIGTPERYWKAQETLANVEIDRDVKKITWKQK